MFDDREQNLNFNAIRLRLASPENILSWSHGEVLKPETINYRTQKPEKDGLFCERIFGPVKDWECYCGKYKKIRYKGIVCDKCGVEVTKSSVRRERMGHIKLAAPVSHIWFLRGVPSRIGLALDLSVQSLEKVIYFASFIIISVNEELKNETLGQLRSEYKQYKKQIENDFDRKINQIKEAKGEGVSEEVIKLVHQKEEKLKELENTMISAEAELKEIKPLKIISEHIFHDLSLKYGHIFDAGNGAEAVRDLLAKIDLDKTIKELQSQMAEATGARRDKLIRRIKFFNHLIKNQLRPEWMILVVVPVIPPDLRPMVPLDGGRFATSDLNDLYRRVINRNNRLKQLLELNAPEVITRNEKRMLQEAVDSLIDNNARHGKTVVASTGQKRMLKSIADMLKGKQGRFRQNLLGKRIDYSGRSVIVVGPDLKLDQCGIPKIMALELFKPFIISKLIQRGIVHNVRSANRYIEAGHDEIWDLLEEVVKGAYVLLNRAPTLHRLGIQAFKPILIEGKAIKIHPLVCSAFNADFDGDQMAVHVPLTAGAIKEAKEIMLSVHNLLKPAHGQPIVTPNQDIVWGCYYLTDLKEAKKIKAFVSVSEAQIAWDKGIIGLQDKIKIKFSKHPEKKRRKSAKAAPKAEILETSLGRIFFNQVLPEDYEFVNERVNKKLLGKILGDIFYRFGPEETVRVLDNLKNLGFKYLTYSAQSLGMGDLVQVKGREELIVQGNQELDAIEQQYQMGLLTEDERHQKIIDNWLGVNNKILEKVKKSLSPDNPIFAMIDSGARGSWGQLSQMIGMKGPVVNPAYEVIELPVKGNFKKGFDVLEFFISTHGARKGLTDTALRTSSAGYLTRRLVDVAQDAVVNSEDCGDTVGLVLTKAESEAMNETLADRILGRYVIEPIKHPKTGKTVVGKGELVDEEKIKDIRELDLDDVSIRSVLTCKNARGVCRKCYGYDLAYNKPVALGTAVGIIAAQSVGEPGTQLTMRTFHTGGVASEGDITQGLPRVEEIFEARAPKAKAIIAEEGGLVSIKEGKREIKDAKGKSIMVASDRDRVIQVSYQNSVEKKIPFGAKKDKIQLKVKDGAKVEVGQTVFENKDGGAINSTVEGKVKINLDSVLIVGEELAIKEYVVPSSKLILVGEGDSVEAGDALTEGSLDLHQIYRLKGQNFVQRYIVKEIQHIYSSQGQKLNDKHVEVIIRQMFSKVYIKDAGDSDYMPGEVLEYIDVQNANAELVKRGKKEIIFDRLLMGITKVSLSTRSWLAAASFQETARVLIDVAVTGRVDDLSGLKENIIIGRLIPAGTGFNPQLPASSR
ncbi:MAG: DNA-directed RNA polymerase subunit beta' [Patescibacteria group bacterium]